MILITASFRDLFQASKRKSSSTKSTHTSLHALYHFKHFKLLVTQETKDTIHKQQQLSQIMRKVLHKPYVKQQNHTIQKLERRARNVEANTETDTNHPKSQTQYFLSNFHMEDITNHQENSKIGTVKISGILIRFWHATGSISKFHGASSKKKQENLQKLKAHGSMAQTHGSDGSGSN